MREIIVRRILRSALTLLGASVVAFAILRVLPGDPARMLLPEGAPESAVEALNEKLGLRQPIHIQYIVFLQGIARADFGQSFQYRAPVSVVIGERIGATLELSAVAFALTVALGVPAGILGAARHRSRLDLGVTSAAALAQSLPNFWLGIMLTLVFGVALRWLPTSGNAGPSSVVLPAVTLAAFPIALVARLTRSSMLEVLGRDYVRTARAKGLRERTVVARHALKNAAIPVVTVLGLQVGVLLGGAVITESVFAWPGIGRLVVDSIFQRDFPVVQAALLLSATVFIIINLLVDLSYSVLDPRIRYS
jgi:ABC-type dipeptide/oligopeptide/nickel transport system permease component